MKRFIFLTFGFMGWAAYEMSGGSEFDPAGQRTASLQNVESPAVAQATTQTGKLVTAAAENAARKIKQREIALAASENNEPRDVTRVALNLTTLSDLPRANDMVMVEKAVAKAPAKTVTKTSMIQNGQTHSISDTGAKVIKASVTAPQTSGYIVSSTSTPAVIQRISNDNDTGEITVTAGKTIRVSAAQNEVQQSDIRTVSGNRVNIRRGPGTNFGIVGKLNAGDAVKVIEDNGAGWVRLRAVDGREMGWMAEFLLASG